MTEVLPALPGTVRPQTPSDEATTPGPLAATYTTTTTTTSTVPSLKRGNSRNSLDAPRPAEPSGLSCPTTHHHAIAGADAADGTRANADGPAATVGAGGDCQIFSPSLEHTVNESAVGGGALRSRQSCAGQPVVVQRAKSPNAVHARRGGSGGNARGTSTVQTLRAPSMPLAELPKARTPSPARLATQTESRSPHRANAVALSGRNALSSPRRGSREATTGGPVVATAAPASPNYYMALLHTALHERRRRFAPTAAPTSPPAATDAQGGSQEEIIRGFMDSLVAKHARTVPAWSARVRTAELYRDRPLRLQGDLAEARPADRNFLERARQGMQEYMTQLADAMELLQRAEDNAASEQLRRDAEGALLRLREDGGGSPDAAASAEAEWRRYCHQQCRVLRDMADEVRTVWRRLERVLAVHARCDPYLPGGAAQGRRSSSARHPSRPRSARASLTAANRDSPRHTAGLLTPPRRSVVADLVAGIAATEAVAERGRSTSYARYACPAEAGGTTSVQRGSPAIHPGHLSPSAAGQKDDGTTRSAAERGEATQIDADEEAAAVQQRQSTSSSAVRPPMLDTDVLGLEEKTQATTLADGRALSPYMRCLVRVNYTPRRTSTPRRDSARRASAEEDALRDPSALPAAVRTPRHGAANALIATDGGAVAPSAVDKVGRMAVATVSEEGRLVARPPELYTYRSPRGRTEAAAPLPLLSPERRMELLRVIVQFERDYTSLQRDNLHRARECFKELYGAQRGLVQYCDWIDDLALKALRRFGTQ